MRNSIRLGRIAGVEIGLHYSWLLIAGLIVYSLSGRFEYWHRDWSSGVIWGAAILTAILFFLSLIAHEMAHSLVARSRGLPVRSITLFALGGVAQIEGESRDAKTEFWMAIAGPITSAAIGAFCLLASSALGWASFSIPETPTLSVLVWLGYINLSLAAFNMIPGFPLDGGRVLHAIVWWLTGDASRSLGIATQAGRIVAILFIASGVIRYLTGAGFGGLWLAFIGWFLLDAAGSSRAQAKLTDLLRTVRVRDLMVRDCPTVDLRANLREFVDERLALSARPSFLVLDGDNVVGLIGPVEVRATPRAQWPDRTVAGVMRPIAALRPVHPEASVADALEEMGRERASQLPVSSDGRLEGIISRADVMGYLQTRRELRG